MGLCGPSIPDPVDPSVAYLQGKNAELANYPLTRQIEAAAQTGGKVTVGGKTYDFKGLSEADYQKQYATAMAASQLQLQKDYGSQFVDQRNKELQLSDPEGYAGRKQLFDLIKGDLGKGRDDTKSKQLQSQILGDLQKGGTLDPQVQTNVLNQVRGRQVNNGITMGTAAAADEARGLAGASESQLANRQQASLQFLTSGAPPEDGTYRSNLQGNSNLANFMSGQTPTAQFGQLAGAQNGAAPFQGGRFLPGVNQNAGQQAYQYATGAWNQQNAYNQGQANPWMSGLGLGLQAYGATQGMFSRGHTPAGPGQTGVYGGSGPSTSYSF